MMYSQRAAQRPSLPVSSASKSDVSATPAADHGQTPVHGASAAASRRGLQSPSFANAMEEMLGGDASRTAGGDYNRPPMPFFDQSGAGRGSAAPMGAEEQISALKAALIATMEEVETLRRDVTVEQGKLQREFRQSVSVILSATEEVGRRGLSGAAGAASAGEAPSRALFSDGLGPAEVASRLEYLEQAVSGLRSTRLSASHAGSASPTSMLEQAATPAAVDAALRRMAEFMQHADREIANANRRLDDEVSTWHRRVETMQQEHRAALSDMRDKVNDVDSTLATHRRRFLSPSRLDGTDPGPVNGDEASGANPGAEPRVSASSFVTLNQVSNMINAQVVEVAALMDAELAKVREQAVSMRAEHDAAARRLDVLNEQMSQVDEEAKRAIDASDKHMAELNRSSKSAESYLHKMEQFVESFTLNEAGSIRDEVLKLVNSDAAVQQRKIEDRHRRDEAAALKQDVVGSLTAIERLQDEVGRIATQQNSLYQAFQRSEQSAQGIQHRVDTEMKGELQRLEQVQKSFFARQEQQLASERHTVLTKMQEDLRRMQERATDDMKASEARRLDDVQKVQQQIRDDFTTFVDQQRKEHQIAVSKLKEDFAAASRQANDEMQRNLQAVNDANKRQHTAAMDEFRRTAARSSDDVRRMQLQVEEMTKRLNDSSTYLQSRMQQALDEEVLRIERMGNEIVLQLNNVVEEEVKRVTKTNDSATQRAISAIEERFSREVKSLRDEASSMRSSVNAIAAPSTSIQTVDARIDVLRKDMSELYDTVAAVRQAEERLVARSRDESRLAVDAARAEIARDVAHQLHRFDGVLVDLSREQALRSEEIASIAMKVDSMSSSVLAPGSPFTQQQPQQARTNRSSSVVSGAGQRAPMPAASGLIATPNLASASNFGGVARSERSDADRALDSLLASPDGRQVPAAAGAATRYGGGGRVGLSSSVSAPRSSSSGGVVVPGDPPGLASPAPRGSTATNDALDGAFDA